MWYDTIDNLRQISQFELELTICKMYVFFTVVHEKLSHIKQRL